MRTCAKLPVTLAFFGITDRLICPIVPLQPGPPARSICEIVCVFVTTSSTGALSLPNSPLQPDSAAASAAATIIDVLLFRISICTPSLTSSSSRSSHDARRDEDEQLVVG